MKSLSVVIPNYNGIELLKQNIPPLKAALAKIVVPHEIIVVDDASGDDSIAFLKENHPDVILVCNPVNLGFADAMNAGITRAQYEIIFSLNSDVKVEENIFPVLLNRFNDSELFSVTPNIIDPRNGKNQASYRLIPGVCWFIDRCPQTLTEEEKKVDYPVFFGSGGATCYDRKKLLLLGGFPIIYAPFYIEDVDLSYQAWKRGWKCLLEPRVKVWHYSSSTIRKHSKYRKIRFIQGRNKHIFLWINITDNTLVLRYLLFLIPSLLWDIVSFRKYKFVGMFMALVKLNDVLIERRKRYPAMVVPDSKVIEKVIYTEPVIIKAGDL